MFLSAILNSSFNCGCCIQIIFKMQPLLDDQNGLFSPQDTFGRGPPDKS